MNHNLKLLIFFIRTKFYLKKKISRTKKNSAKNVDELKKGNSTSKHPNKSKKKSDLS